MKKNMVPAYVKAAAKAIKNVITFTVTLDEVKGSVVADFEDCPGARALCKLSGVKHAWVLNSVTYLEFTDGTYGRGVNSGRLKNGIQKFDNTAGLFPPGVYEIRPPTFSQTAAYFKKRNEVNPSRDRRKAKNSSGKERTAWAVR